MNPKLTGLVTRESFLLNPKSLEGGHLHQPPTPGQLPLGKNPAAPASDLP